MNTAVMMSSAQQDWRTPKALFDAVSALAGGFDLDAAADADNALCSVWLGPGGLCEDALEEEWELPRGRTHVWLNPPYGVALRDFAAKAVEQVERHDIDVWMLVPARVDTRWWNEIVTRAQAVYFLAGRVRFERPDGARDAAPFPSAVLKLGYGGGKTLTPKVFWGWRP